MSARALDAARQGLNWPNLKFQRKSSRAEGPSYTSMGRIPMNHAKYNPRAEGPTYKARQQP
jgi:hypothetical protein